MAKMMLTFVLILALLATGFAAASAEDTTENAPRLLYQGHGSLRIVTGDDKVIYNTDALVDGEYRIFDLGFATVEAVQAGNNRNHDINECVGWLVTLPGEISVYATGDTSTTEQMAELADRDIHYAFFVCDGRFNMDMEEAIACANLVQARHSIPYHMAPGALFDRERAELFDVPGQLILSDGEEIILE